MTHGRSTRGVPFLLLAFAACPQGGPADSSAITLTGRVGGVAQAPLEGTPQVGAARQGLRTSAGPITTVLAYRGFGRADTAPLDAQGRFTIDVSRGQPVGLVFLDPTDAVVGVLGLGDGLAALPLSFAPEALAELDLAVITVDGGVATASANPVEPGGALALDETQRAVFGLQAALFSTIARNLDLNRDDVIDVLSPRPYWLMFQAHYAVAAPQGAPAPGDAGLPAFTDFRLLFSDGQPVALSPQPTLRLPGGKVLDRVNPESRWTGDSDGSQLPSYVWSGGMDSPGFTAGSYALTYGSPPSQLTFDVTHPLLGQHHLVALEPWWEPTAGDKLTLHWRWGLAGGGGANVDGPKLFKFLIPGLHFTDGSTSHVNQTPDPAATSFTFDLNGKQPQRWSLTARDHFGNETTTQGPLQ